MELIGLVCESEATPRLSYVLDVLNHHPFVECLDIKFQIGSAGGQTISYGSRKEDCNFLIPEARNIFRDKSNEVFINSYSFKDKMIYSIDPEERNNNEFCKGSLFGFDIFEMIFFHFSRYEERRHKFSDYLTTRYEFEKKLALVKFGLEKIPVVDELIAAFIEVVTGRKEKFEKPISLSHDIDYIQKFKSPFSIIRKVAGHFRHRKSLLGFGYLWQSYMDYLLRGKDGFDTFDWMLSKKNIDKSIYFLVGGVHKEDNEYDLKGRTFQKALKLSKERQYKIGIHPSYESWNDLVLIRAEKEKLEDEVGEEIVMSRQHFLNFDIDITPKILESIGIKEDSSLGFARHTGYRCGTGFPYNLYDFKHEKAFDVVERPMVFMDVAWLFESIRNDEKGLPDFSKLYGDFLFHNSTFDEMGARKIPMKESFLKFFQI